LGSLQTIFVRFAVVILAGLILCFADVAQAHEVEVARGTSQVDAVPSAAARAAVEGRIAEAFDIHFDDQPASSSTNGDQHSEQTTDSSCCGIGGTGCSIGICHQSSFFRLRPIEDGLWWSRTITLSTLDEDAASRPPQPLV
jgi:hypothetical protein